MNEMTNPVAATGGHAVESAVASVSMLPRAPSATRCESGHYALSPTILTPREHQVLSLLSRGLPNKAIANALGDCSELTVRKHVSAILRKLGVSNRTEAALVATAKQ